MPKRTRTEDRRLLLRIGQELLGGGRITAGGLKTALKANLPHIQWALGNLKRRGLLQEGTRGRFTLTPLGRKRLNEAIDKLEG